MVAHKPSLAYAEMLEDIAEHLVGGYFAQYVGQVVETLAKVLTDKVAGKAVEHGGGGAVYGGEGRAEGLVVAQVAHERGGAVGGGGIEGGKAVGKDGFQPRYIRCGVGGNGERGCGIINRSTGHIVRFPMIGNKMFGQERFGLGERGGGNGVGLVDNGDERFTLRSGKNFGGKTRKVFGDGGGIEHPNDHVGAAHHIVRAVYAHALYGVGRVAQTRRVDKAHRHFAHGDYLLHRVARGAVYVAHKGAIVAHEGVEQGRFSRIRFAHNRHRYALAQCVALVERSAQAVDVVVNFVREGEQLAAVGKLQILVVREVEFKFEQRGEMEQAVAQIVQFAAETAPHLLHRYAVVGRRGRSDQVCHCLSTAQVHLSV